MKKEKKIVEIKPEIVNGIKIYRGVKNWDEVKEIFKNSISQKTKKEFTQYLNNNAQKHHECNKIVPFRWKHILLPGATNKNKYCYLLDPNIKSKRHFQNKIYLKLYYDIVEWFWNNSETVCDDKDKYLNVQIDPSIKRILSNKISRGNPLLKVTHFATNNELEFIYHDHWVVLYLAPARANKLNVWLASRGWQKNSIVCPEECPGFLKRSKNHKDEVVILNSLIEWNSYKQEEKDNIIHHYKKLGFEYYPHARFMKIQQCNHNLLLKPCNFIKFNKNNEEGGYYLII